MDFNNQSIEYEGFIYLVKNLINGKCYVGQTTTSIKRRWNQHCYDASKSIYNMPLHKAIRKYGVENFTINEIESVKCVSKTELKEKLNSLEIYYIQYYDTYYGDGYNATMGGDSAGLVACKPVDVYYIDGTFIETISSIAETEKKYNCSSVSDICNGRIGNFCCTYVFRHHNDDFDLYDITTPEYQVIYQFSLTGKLINIHYNYSQAIYSVSDKYSNAIRLTMDIPNLQAYGYWWSSTSNFNYKGRKNTKKVDLYDNELNYIGTFDTITSCANYVGVDSTIISNICMGKLGICKGYIARYHGDDVLKYKVNLDGDFTVKGVDEYSLNGELLETYETATLAADRHNGSTSAICGCCKGKYQTAYNRVWRYKGEPFDKFPVDFIHFGKEVQVDQYTLDGEFIKTWNSATLAANSLGHKHGTFILNVAKGKKIQAYGFVWRYKGHPFNEYRVSKINSKQINQYDSDLNYIKTWNSAVDIKKFYNYSSDSKIYRSLRKETPICDGMIFFYANDPTQPDKTKIISNEIIKEVS
ncbi:MAG: GIY-YIG nuclease family protein [Alphaproteobacteria bacterium]|nr:GIY-YIG nuclease family protein [Alphaproteobacteria bacterium]